MAAIDQERMPSVACTTCDFRSTPEGGEYTCPVDQGILDIRYDYSRILNSLTKEQLTQNRDQTIWRYRPLLPISSAESTNRYLPPLPVGGTPLHDSPRLAEHFGLQHLFLKDDTRNPTGSLKDRASAIAVVRAQEEVKQMIATASTGNAASSIAGLASSVGLQTIIFVPRAIPKPKLSQIVAYGTTVVCIDGSYDEAYALCEKACNQFSWYNRNTAKNPYLSEGKKTVSYEICEQMQWDTPDKVLVPMGDGCVIGGVWKGFKDFHAMGFVHKLPQLIGVQPEGSNSLYQAFIEGRERAGPVHAKTIADSLAVDLPKDDVKALNAIRESGGTVVQVSDQNIREAQLLLARKTGIFAEPAACTTVAGLQDLKGNNAIGENERIVLLLTGTGLKDTESLREHLEALPVIQPTLPALEKLLDDLKSQ